MVHFINGDFNDVTSSVGHINVQTTISSNSQYTILPINIVLDIDSNFRLVITIRE